MNCDRCDRTLLEDEPRFVVSFRVTADWTGRVSAPQKEGSELEAALKECAAMGEDELNAEVDETRAFTVCAACRMVLRANPLQRADGSTTQTGRLQ